LGGLLVVEAVFTFRQFIDFLIFHRHRLESVEMLPLGASIDEAIKLYGEPFEKKPSEDALEITEYGFWVGSYHEAVIFEYQGKVQSITYWSAKSDPGRDLRCMLDRYKEDSHWRVMEEGFWYQRMDEKLRLWCSAIPAIGIAYVDFLETKTNFKTAHSLTKLDSLTDVTWAPNDAIEELQRQFVTEQNKEGLTKLAARSDMIAVSPNGEYVYVVRNHHAYDVQDGFMELNTPPKPDDGYSTQVINCFHRSEAGSSWGKMALPRDADVECIRFEGDECHLRIRQTTTGRVLSFRGPASLVRGLGTLVTPYNDKDLWRGLEEDAESVT